MSKGWDFGVTPTDALTTLRALKKVVDSAVSTWTALILEENQGNEINGTDTTVSNEEQDHINQLKATVTTLLPTATAAIDGADSALGELRLALENLRQAYPTPAEPVDG